ncbi:uncharacterized protein LOC143894798 [Temnothorax americanus]|uniref:uncharacterized protein LOC143894798 n=1 Tax=Temnothorax americanus TaxID=1964332 RepID=UPI0040688C9B
MGSDRKQNRDKIEEAVNIIAKNLELLGLDLEPKKTTLVEYSRSGFVNDNISIMVKGVTIPNSSESRFLGVRVDNQVKFEGHIQDVRAKIEKANSILKYLNSVTRGTDCYTALLLYKSLVRSVTDYGCFVYAPTTGSLRLKLERGQYLGLRTALGTRNSTPTNVLVAEAKVDLLSVRAMMLAKNFCTKMIKYGNPSIRESIDILSQKEMLHRMRHPQKKKSIISLAWDRVKLFRKDIGQSLNNFEVWDMNYEDLTEDITIDTEIGFSHSAGRKTKERRRLEEMKYEKKDLDFIKEFCDEHDLENPMVIYTDGSKLEDSVATGASVIFENNSQALYASLPKMWSSFSAEAFAISTALKKLEKDQDQGKGFFKNVLILSDCQSVLKAIKNNRLDVYKSSLILDIRRRHFRLKNKYGCTIIYGWIPAHRGYTGNEMADLLAKEGASEEAMSNFPIPISDLRCIFKEEAWNSTQDVLISESSYKGKDYFRNFYNKNTKQPCPDNNSCRVILPSRRDYHTVHARTHHARFTK